MSLSLQHLNTVSALATSAAMFATVGAASAQDAGESTRLLVPVPGGGPVPVITSERPEVGTWNGCTATRVSQRTIVTAAHCMDYASIDFRNTRDAPRFRVTYEDGTSETFGSSSTVSFGAQVGQDDLMLVEIFGMHERIPIASFATTPPSTGDAVTQFGYGCTVEDGSGIGAGVKRKIDVNWGPTMVGCPGDSGGPIFNADGQIIAVHSGGGLSNDVRANPFNRVLGLRAALIAYEERSWGNEPLCANERNPNVTAIYGDVDGNGMVDALCNANLTTNGYTNLRKGSYGRYAPDQLSRSGFCTHATAELHLGDFNGDRRMDLMCHDTQSGWRVVDFASTNYSNPFAGSDYQMRDRWCSHDTAEVHLGDFDGDGRTDLLCHDHDSGRKWYIYTSTNTAALFDPNSSTHRAWGVNWCNHDTARVFTGDVDGDGVTDVICHSQNSGAVDVAFHQRGDRSNGFPGTNWYNHGLGFCTNPNATVRLMDFTYDGHADLICEAPIDEQSEAIIAQPRGTGRQDGVYQRTDSAGRTGARSQVVSRWESGFLQPTVILNPAANPWQRPQ